MEKKLPLSEKQPLLEKTIPDMVKDIPIKELSDLLKNISLVNIHDDQKKEQKFLHDPEILAQNWDFIIDKTTTTVKNTIFYLGSDKK